MTRQSVATASNFFFQHPHQQSPVYPHQHQQQQHSVQYLQQYHDQGPIPSGYRPLQLPLRHSLQQQQADQQQQQTGQHSQQQHQLSLASASTSNLNSTNTGFHASDFRAATAASTNSRYHHQPPAPELRSSRQQHLNSQPSTGNPTNTMAFAQNAVSDEELAEMQKLSNEFEPEVTGPLVGHREPSTAITTEYASADPVLQAKTSTLPQKYSHYRKLRGDGKCGWRAVAFGYFETLIRLGNDNKFLEEEGRLRSLGNVLNNAGFDPLLYEDFADEAFDLLRKIGGGLQSGNADEMLFNAFNDDTLQNYVITYLKTLTSAWMKTRPAEYAPWLMGQTVERYCDIQVMPIGSEIDNVSLSALKDVFLSPAGIQLEILYLDRTEGSEVNLHRFDPIHTPAIGSIRLLYRPGHYDIVYKAEDIPPAPTSIQTYLQYGTHHEPGFDLAGSDFLTMIPGMSFANQSNGWMSGSSYGSSDFFPSQTQQCTQPMPAPVASPTQPLNHTQSACVSAGSTHMVAPPDQMPQEMAIRSASHDNSPTHPSFQPQLTGPFRPSVWELEPDFGSATSQMPFTTSIFRNSHFNTAHFLNPDFQPEEWRPDDDYVTTTSKNPPRHKSFG